MADNLDMLLCHTWSTFFFLVGVRGGLGKSRSLLMNTVLNPGGTRLHTTYCVENGKVFCKAELIFCPQRFPCACTTHLHLSNFSIITVFIMFILLFFVFLFRISFSFCYAIIFFHPKFTIVSVFLVRSFHDYT